MSRLNIDFVENMPPLSVGWVNDGDGKKVIFIALDGEGNPTALLLSDEGHAFCDPSRLPTLASFLTDAFDFEVDPASMEDWNHTDQKFGGVVLARGELRLMIKLQGRVGYASFRLGEFQGTETPRQVIYQNWQIVDTTTKERKVIYKRG